VVRVLDAVAIQRWADASVDLLDLHRDELDRINIYPVADGDTGTNLALTLTRVTGGCWPPRCAGPTSWPGRR
jgi:dihydroxyacetone kinase-like predicted kinase